MKRPSAIGRLLFVTSLALLPAIQGLATGTNAAPAAAKDSGGAATNSPPAELPVPLSTFELTEEARDPFFPLSTRHAVAPKVTNAAPVFSATNFSLKGLSGSSGHRLAVINNRTFAPGEKWEITTPNGKFTIICEEIREHSVVIREDSQLETIELFLRKEAQ